MQSRLTPFRKTRRPASQSPGRSLKRTSPGTGVAGQAARAWRLDWLDELDECCKAIETVARLLEGYGDDTLDGGLARETGSLIVQRTRQLKALRDKMEAAR